MVRTTIDTIPKNVPYLFIPQELINKWKPFFNKHSSTFNIGICWRGDAAHSGEKFMPLSYFKHIATLPHVRLFSLQYDNGHDEEIDLFPLHRFDDSFDRDHGNFMDSAAVMHHLDLVITVDTSIAHLAGGLGIPV